MSQNVVSFVNGEVPMEAAPPDEHVIKQLEWLLEAARAGEVQGLAGAFLYRDGTAISFSVGYRSLTLIGAMEKRKTMLLNWMIEDDA